MKCLPALIAMLAVLAVLDCGEAQAQARGPDAKQIRETGQEILGRWARLQREMQAEEQLDDAARAVRLAELGAFLQRLVGRFRIDGQIEAGGGGDRPTGVVDCDEIGEGAGVQCIINANWAFFETPPITQTALPQAEALNTMRPAVLVLGLNHYPLGIRSMLVPADSIVHTWIGRLDENTLRSTDVPERLGTTPEMQPVILLGMSGEEDQTIFDATSLEVGQADCDDRCLRWFDIIARPESEIVTLQFQGSGVTIKFILHRDPEAQADGKMRLLKAR